MKGLLFVGSPQRGGNTELLADAFLEGAKSAGHEIRKFHCSGMRIAPCLGCRTCWKDQNPCVLQDDMTAIYEAFEESEILIFASPVYFDGFSAQLKTMIDRLYCIGGHCGFRYPFRECALLMVAESHRETCFDLPLAHYRRLFTEYMGWKSRGEVLVRGVDEKGDILGNPGLKEAFHLGASL